MTSVVSKPRDVVNGGPRTGVAIVGAGLAGLTAATALAARGLQVTIVDKSRGPGGRMSTRRDGAYRFDHGAQYFTARDPGFLAAVDDWIGAGHVAVWDARIGVVEDGATRPADGGTTRYVGVPGMSAVCRTAAAGLDDCRFGWHAVAAVRQDGHWVIDSQDGERIVADDLIVTTPPRQALALLGDASVAAAIGRVSLEPCWALMAVFDASPLPGWDAAFVNAGPLAWIASQLSKPGRPAAEAWVLHASPAWSAGHLEDDPTRVCDRLLDALRALPGAAPAGVRHAVAHRWRYSIAALPLHTGSVSSADRRLVVAGDWCCGSRVEGAFLSGRHAAGRILDDLG